MRHVVKSPCWISCKGANRVGGPRAQPMNPVGRIKRSKSINGLSLLHAIKERWDDAGPGTQVIPGHGSWEPNNPVSGVGGLCCVINPRTSNHRADRGGTPANFPREGTLKRQGSRPGPRPGLALSRTTRTGFRTEHRSLVRGLSSFST